MNQHVKDRLNALKSKLSEHQQPKLGKSKGSIYDDEEYQLKIRINELEQLIKKL
jgi:hypothetical protein